MNKLFQFVLLNRLLMLVFGAIVLVGGYASYRSLPVDAFPDVTPVLVQVFTETEGLAPEEVEKYVTYPVEVAMNGLPSLKEIRSISNFGLSVVNIYFQDGTDIYFARQLVGERLQLAREEVGKGFGDPEMGPISTGLGQILFYFVEDETGKRTPQEMREIQDWLIKFNLQTVPGITEILSLGGEVKQYQVQIRPSELLRFGISISNVVDAIKANNSNVGAQYIVKNGELYVVRSVGLARDIADLKGVVLKTVDGAPIHLHDVADVVIGGELRQGLATRDGKGEAVVGMVLKLIGTNTSEVIKTTKARMVEINKVLPPGIRVVPYYDQATLVAKCIRTVMDALIEGVVLVTLVILAFLGALRPSLVVAVSIPFSILFTFILMKAFNISANLMSMGGLAIAIGMMVDGTIVMVENVDRRLNEADRGESRLQIIIRACAEVGRPIFFSVLIIIVVFLPLFSLQGVEGKTFKPLAYTLSIAMLGSLIFAMFLAPVASHLVMRRPKAVKAGGQYHEPFLIRTLLRVYQPMVRFFVTRHFAAVLLAVVILVGGLLIFPRLGSEFVPRLNEGDLLVRATMAPSISLEESRDTMLRFERQLMEKFPEVTRVVTRVGRGEVGAHADPVNSAEAFVGLKPMGEWTSAKEPDALYAEMSEAFEHFPGVRFNFTQPIAAAVDELLTGTKAELAIKIFGADANVLKEKASEVERVVQKVKGAADVQRDQTMGTPQVRISMNYPALARYGINVESVQNMIRTAVGGEKAGQVFEDVRRFDIVVMYEPRSRDSAEAMRQILVKSPSGVDVPMSELTSIEEIVGPRQVTRENNQRFVAVQCNVRGRDIGSFVTDAQQAIAAEVKLPPGYLITWGGQFQLQQEANKRLALVVPVTLLIVFLLLFSSFGSLKNTLLILLNIPLGLVGGVAALWITGQNLSVPSSVGFIALFGIVLANGMVLVTCINQLVSDGVPMGEASVRGACMRLRPVLMTALCAMLGLIPLLFSSGTGSEVQRPLATVVIGGLFSSTVLTLLVIPAIYKWFAIKVEHETIPSEK